MTIIPMILPRGGGGGGGPLPPWWFFVFILPLFAAALVLAPIALYVGPFDRGFLDRMKMELAIPYSGPFANGAFERHFPCRDNATRADLDGHSIRRKRWHELMEGPMVFLLGNPGEVVTIGAVDSETALIWFTRTTQLRDSHAVEYGGCYVAREALAWFKPKEPAK